MFDCGVATGCLFNLAMDQSEQVDMCIDMCVHAYNMRINMYMDICICMHTSLYVGMRMDM